MITILRISKDNFAEASMDAFVRTQEVTQVWRKIGGKYTLMECPFTEDWLPERKRKVARLNLDEGNIAYGAFDGSRVAGYIRLKKQLVGGRMILESFHVDRGYRRKGIGRQLFQWAVKVSKSSGAGALYISACPAVETIAFYSAMGCKVTQAIIPEIAEHEPFDLQLEYELNPLEWRTHNDTDL